MVGIAQLVEHWTVAPSAAGSSPVTHPFLLDAKASSRKSQAPNSKSQVNSKPKDIIVVA